MQVAVDWETYLLFCHTANNNTKIMDKEKREERMMVTVARRPKGNYEAYAN